MARRPMWRCIRHPEEGRAYVVPEFGREHDTKNPHCWCGPRFRKPCPECGDAEGGCFACDLEGWVDVKDPAPDEPFLVVIHGPHEE